MKISENTTFDSEFSSYTSSALFSNIKKQFLTDEQKGLRRKKKINKPKVNEVVETETVVPIKEISSNIVSKNSSTNISSSSANNNISLFSLSDKKESNEAIDDDENKNVSYVNSKKINDNSRRISSSHSPPISMNISCNNRKDRKNVLKEIRMFEKEHFDEVIHESEDESVQSTPKFSHSQTNEKLNNFQDDYINKQDNFQKNNECLNNSDSKNILGYTSKIVEELKSCINMINNKNELNKIIKIYLKRMEIHMNLVMVMILATTTITVLIIIIIIIIIITILIIIIIIIIITIIIIKIIIIMIIMIIIIIIIIT